MRLNQTLAAKRLRGGWGVWSQAPGVGDETEALVVDSLSTVSSTGPPDDHEDLGAWCNKTDDADVADFVATFDAEIVEESPPDRR